MRLILRALFAAGLLLSIGGCATNMSRPIQGTEYTAYKPDLQTIAEMDRSLVGDQALLSYVRGILDKLNAQLPKPCECDIVVDTQSGYEAYTLSSRTIVVSAGLIAQAETEDELAAIIAHELSHVVNEDQEGTELREGLAFLARAGDLATGGGGSLLFGDAIEAAAQGLIYNRWDKEEELRADRFAVNLLAKAGYSQNGLKMAIRRLSAYSQDVLASKSHGPKCVDGGFEKKNINVTACASALTGADDTVYLNGKDRLKAAISEMWKLDRELRRLPVVAETRRFESVEYLYAMNSLVSTDKDALIEGLRHVESLPIPKSLESNDVIANRLFMSSVLVGDEEKATEYLFKSFDSDHRTVATYRNLLWIADKRQDRDLVEKVMGEMRKDIGWSSRLLPYEAYLAKRYGLNIYEIETTLRCASNLAKDTGIYQKCAELTKKSKTVAGIDWWP